MNFNAFSWHDAVIRNIQIDRSNPGRQDTILFEIIWPEKRISKILFTDVYWSKMIMGFGIVAKETILSAVAIEDDEDKDLSEIRKKWKQYLDNIKLVCYVIKTASTGSEFKIIAKNFDEII
jgi:hypothetical protein